MSERVTMIVSVYENAELLPHFIAHYHALGVDTIWIVVRTRLRDDVLSMARASARNYPARVVWRACDRFADSDRAAVEHDVLVAAGLEPDDYVIYCDLDEFQEYPAPLAEIVRDMNAHDDWALRGWLVDRVAADGALASIRAMPSIGEQFPIGCDLTTAVLGAWGQKIVLCRFRVQLEGGVRHDTLNAYYERVPFGRPEDYRIHHFKWTSGIDARIEGRLSAYIGSKYREECETFLTYFREKRRIDLSDPLLNTRFYGPLPVASSG